MLNTCNQTCTDPVKNGMLIPWSALLKLIFHQENCPLEKIPQKYSAKQTTLNNTHKQRGDSYTIFYVNPFVCICEAAF